MSKKALYDIRPVKGGGVDIYETESENTPIHCVSWNQASQCIRKLKQGRFFNGFTPKFFGTVKLKAGDKI